MSYIAGSDGRGERGIDHQPYFIARMAIVRNLVISNAGSGTVIIAQI